jgi:hypothetical protein
MTAAAPAMQRALPKGPEFRNVEIYLLKSDRTDYDTFHHVHFYRFYKTDYIKDQYNRLSALQKEKRKLSTV